eukprot:TRINITY_DN4188_c0_g3_i1.p1 TRINITY_DN4188_c0_g3~~TRINITY_DN4188_c0_g3_i1.p1  ORF type:complete len:466 (-),score=44.19 TRINITY_DN4188_c0_g3_i1:89-1411(-)
MASVTETQTVQRSPSTKADVLENRLGPSSRPRVGAFESTPEALSGAINFGIIITLLYTAQKCIDNFFEKGYVIDLSLLKYLARDWHIAIGLQLAMFLWCLVTMFPLTTLAVRRRIPYPVALTLYIISQSVLWTLPLVVVFTREFSPLLGTSTSMHIAVDSMKIHSYWATNWILATKETKIKRAESKTEDGAVWAPPMGLKEYLYFLMAPTLIYETEYPRTTAIRWKHFLLLSLQAFASCFVMYVIITEDLIPVYHASVSFPLWRAVFRLALPSFAMWLLIFYLLFHCILGMIAEVTKFADREFYLDWWNAKTFGDWWRKWNRPVHRWLSRHIYFDSMHTMKYEKDIAALATFALSALVHEIVLSVAFGMIRPILFTTVILQVAVIYLTNLPIFANTGIGNATMWLCLMLGQPGVQILYAREWMLLQDPASPSPSAAFSLM